MFYRKFACATQVLLCKYNRYKLENIENEPNDTHIPYFLAIWARLKSVLIKIHTLFGNYPWSWKEDLGVWASPNAV